MCMYMYVDVPVDVCASAYQAQCNVYAHVDETHAVSRRHEGFVSFLICD
jgi:hypothetical protein